jgi:CubicO group peptidase (beta-lactamase class C family)
MMITIEEVQLERATPESQGVHSQAILDFIDIAERDIHELHSFMLLRHGKVIAEGWWSPYQRNDPHMLFSLSKSFTSTAVGLAVAEGRLSVDDTVISFFPDEAPAAPNEHLAAMRVRHLLAMSTGHDTDTMPPMIARNDGNWINGFFEVPVEHAPGTHFLYNTGATYMLSAILQKLTGQKLVDYLEPRLFAPLGIHGARWEESPQRINTGGFGLSITTEDIARFGQLYLQKGVWHGKQIVPAGWIAEATALHTDNGSDPNSEWTQGYGYQFWRCRHNAYRGDGAFGQYCIVMPDQDAVMAITAGLSDMQKPMNLIWDILLPAITSSALPDDPATQTALREKLESLNIAPVTGSAESPLAESINGRRYVFEPNKMNIESVAFAFSEYGCTVTIKNRMAYDSITCGSGEWTPGQTRLFNQPWEIEPAPIVASGAWTADDRYTTVVRFHHTPFYITFHNLYGDRITVESRVNVGFELPQTIVLEGTLAPV